MICPPFPAPSASRKPQNPFTFYGRTAAAIVVAACLSRECPAQVSAYADRDAFIAATGATPEAEWPNVGQIPGAAAAQYQQGHLRLSVSLPSSGFWIGSGNHPSVGPDWTTLVPGNDIAIDGRENLNVQFDAPVRAVGFHFAEPTTITVSYDPCSTLCPCSNSTFQVNLLRNGEPVATTEFSRPDNVASFVGFSSAQPFDRMEIREIGGTCDDEYFGRFWIALVPTCPADFNEDGEVNPDDLGDFINCYFTLPPCPRSDFNTDGETNPDDLGDFINVYFGPPC